MQIILQSKHRFQHLPGSTIPFSSPEVCAGGLYSAVSFDTGLVDASVIGVNAASTHKFRRRTTCSPLNISEPYVTRIDHNGNLTGYEYYYGSKDGSNYTFDTFGHPFEWPIPAYSAKWAVLYRDVEKNQIANLQQYLLLVTLPRLGLLASHNRTRKTS